MPARFFLNGTNEVRVEVSPSINRKKDETFDGAKVTLEFNDDPKPVPAGTPFHVVEDILTTYAYIVASDVVETASQKPLKYKHTLTLVEPVSRYKQRMPRNLIFTQPADMEAKGSVSKLFWINYLPGNGNPGNTGAYWGAGFSAPFARPMATDGRTKLANLMGKCTIRKTYVRNGSDPDPDNWELKSDELTYAQTPCGLYAATVRLTYGDGFHRDYTLNQMMPTAGKWAVLPSSAVNDFNVHGGPITADVTKNILGLSATGSDELGYYVTISIELSATAYYFTLLDVVRELFDAAAQKHGEYQTPKYFRYAMPMLDSDLKAALEGTIAPNLTFTQSTLYESLAEVFRYLDGRPCTIATHDEDQQGNVTTFWEYLGIKYFSDLKEDMTSAVFDENGTFKLAGRVSSSSIERRADGIKSYYQNALQRVRFPDDRHMGRVRSVTLAVPGEGDFAIVVPEPIEKVTKVEMLVKPRVWLFSGVGGAVGALWLTDPVRVDLTDFFFEQSIWSDLPQVGNVDYNGAQSDYTEILQNICLPYSKGSKSIDLTKRYDYLGQSFQRLNLMRHAAVHKFLGQGRKDGWTFSAFGSFNAIDLNRESLPNELSWAEYRIRIEYIAKTEGVAEVESPSHKMEGDLLSNQAGGGIDLGKMGANMLGLAMKGGEPKFTATIEITNLANRIGEGDYIRADDGVYVAGSISYTMLSDGKIQETVEFVKNFNSLSPFIRVDEEKRLSNIDYSIAERCEDSYMDYLIFVGTGAGALPVTSGMGTAVPSAVMADWVNSAFPCNEPTENTADLAFIDKRRDGDYVVSNDRIALPLRVYQCGNAVCMEASFDDPMSAGNSLRWTGSKYDSKAVTYAGEHGFFDGVDFHIAKATGEIFDEYYPFIIYNVGNGIEDIAKIEWLGYHKRPNEIFGLNYEICAVPADGLESAVFVGRRFVGQFGPLSASRKSKGTMRLYYSDESYSVLDEDGLGDYVEITSITASANGSNPHAIDVIISAPIAAIAWKSFAICDSEGKIYLACNQAKPATPLMNFWILRFVAANRRL